jgi:NDP-sugar pyrophosphorylase family protein
MVSIVLMVAGMSSRFGGKLKQFAEVGINGETLIEVAMQQAKKTGFEKIIFIVGEKTEVPFKERFGNSFEGVPIKYTKQGFDSTKRDKPWGTAEALATAKQLVNEPFVICNGDDIYGENSLKIVKDFLEKNPNLGCSVGYKLGGHLPENGKVNRGIFEIDENSFVKSIREEIGIEKNNLIERNLNEETLVSVNLFGFPKKVISELDKKVIEFKRNHENDRNTECFLPTELEKLIKENKLQIKLLKTNDKILGITNPGDEDFVHAQLVAQHQ